MLRVRFNSDETGWAEDLGDGRVRVDNIPAFDEKWLLDDVVDTKVVRGMPTLSKLVTRVFAGKAVVFYSKVEHYYKLRANLTERGCKTEGMAAPKKRRKGFFCVVYPKNVDVTKVCLTFGCKKSDVVIAKIGHGQTKQA